AEHCADAACGMGGKKCAGCRADHSGNDQYLATAKRISAFTHKPVNDHSVYQHARRSHQKGDCREPACLRKREMMRCLQVSRQPCQVEPCSAVDAAEAEHQDPDCALAEEMLPVLERNVALDRTFSRSRRVVAIYR